jgi:hypothetical protein
LRHAPGPGLGSRKHSRAVFVLFCLAAGLSLAVGGSAAQAQRNSFAASAAGIVGGPFDADGEDDPGLDQTGFQLGFSWDTWDSTRVGVRAARVAFSDEFLDGVFDPELTFVTVAGEYLFNESFYRSGLYLGLGLYQLDGHVGLEQDDDTSIGLVLGATGDFPMTDRFSILVELSGHYADLELGGAQLFGFLTAGVAFHF